MPLTKTVQPGSLMSTVAPGRQPACMRAAIASAIARTLMSSLSVQIDALTVLTVEARTASMRTAGSPTIAVVGAVHDGWRIGHDDAPATSGHGVVTATATDVDGGAKATSSTSEASALTPPA